MFESNKRELRVGSGFDEDRVRDDEAVAEHHCLLVRKAGEWLVLDEDDERFTYVNGHRIDTQTPLGPGDRIGVGPFDLELQVAPIEAVEARLIADARGPDDAARLVYADWLESRGHADRAEFLRLQPALSAMTPTDPQFASTVAHLRRLSAATEVGWRMKLARPPVEGCRVAKEFTCTMDWGSLAPTERPGVRACDVCKQEVHYGTTEQDAAARASEGHCIVVDLGLGRPVRAGERSAPALPGTYLPAWTGTPIPAVPAGVRPWTCPGCWAPMVGPRCARCGAERA